MASADGIIASLRSSKLSPLEHVSCEDQSGGCGAKFELVVVSVAFEGVPLLARHRDVQAILAEDLKSIHALTIKPLTPAQWKAKQGTPAPSG